MHRELGSDAVSEAIEDGAAISAVNISEIVSKLTDKGASELEIHEAIDYLDLNVVEFGTKLAYEAGLLRQKTRSAGLSFGDRACLALALELKLPVLTADRAWSTIDVGVTVRVIR